MILIVPRDVMRARRPDEHFATEAEAALSSARYTGFADALGARGTVLRTDASRFRRAHELPAGMRPGPMRASTSLSCTNGTFVH